MVFFNYSTMQMAAKGVYYGPGLCGKTTNLQHIYSHTSNSSRGEMVSLETETDRTLFFDFLPIDLGDISGFRTRFMLYTVPGQVYYNATRKLVLKGVDAVVNLAGAGIGQPEFVARRALTLKLSCDQRVLYRVGGCQVGQRIFAGDRAAGPAAGSGIQQRLRGLFDSAHAVSPRLGCSPTTVVRNISRRLPK